MDKNNRSKKLYVMRSGMLLFYVEPGRKKENFSNVAS